MFKPTPTRPCCHPWLAGWGPGLLLLDGGTQQLLGEEMTAPGEALREAAGLLLPSPCPLGQAWTNHGLGISHGEQRVGRGLMSACHTSVSEELIRPGCWTPPPPGPCWVPTASSRRGLVGRAQAVPHGNGGSETSRKRARIPDANDFSISVRSCAPPEPRAA